MAELTKVSTKGQVVIPTAIRKELALKEGSQLVVSRMQDFIILKKIDISDPKKEFKELTGIGIKHAKKLGLRSDEDVVRILHGRRSKN